MLTIVPNAQCAAFDYLCTGCVAIAAGDMNMQRGEAGPASMRDVLADPTQPDSECCTFDVVNNDYNDDPRQPDKRPKTFQVPIVCAHVRVYACVRVCACACVCSACVHTRILDVVYAEEVIRDIDFQLHM